MSYEYEVVDGRRIRVRPREVNTEVDADGYFHRQPNRFTEGFGEGKNPVEAGRYHLVWAKLCHWSNRASIVRELLGLEEAISVNLVNHGRHEKNLGWEFVYDENFTDPELGIRFLSEAYYAADDSYDGRTTVPALIDKTTGKVVNNDYNRLTNYFEVEFRPFHKPGAPDLYPEELRGRIDRMNKWLFDNVNNAVYRASFARSKEAHFDAFYAFYAALDLLEKRLSERRFLFGDYITDADVGSMLPLQGWISDIHISSATPKSALWIIPISGAMPVTFGRSRLLGTTPISRALQIPSIRWEVPLRPSMRVSSMK